MKKYPMYSFFIAGLMAWQVQAQPESKTFRKSMPVNGNVKIDVKTNHANVDFETWNKNVVEIETVVETEGLSREEAEAYFKASEVYMEGDKNAVTIAVGNARRGFPAGIPGVPDSIAVAIPPVPPVPPVPAVPPIPPLPPEITESLSGLPFDFTAYEKDGKRYMEAWKDSLHKVLNGDFRKSMEAWKEEMEENMQKMKAGMNASAGKTRVIYLSGDEGAQNIRVKSSGGEKKHIRIHKKILIRIPKEARLHLQTRYGAVKLPGNLTDIRADMSYTRLFADQVNGSETFIETSYAPVAVKNWAHGKLTVNYSDSVVLDRVGAIDLVMNTSDVRVKEVYRKGSVHGSFGSLQIDRTTRDIDTLQLRLNNTDAVVRLPESDFVFLVSGENSEVDLPGRLEVSTSVKGSRTDIKGYYKKEDSGRSISVKARYSDLKFH